MNKILKKYAVPAGFLLSSSLGVAAKANAEVLGTMKYVSNNPVMVETCLGTSGILEKIDPDDRNSFIQKLSNDFKKYNTGMEAQLDLKQGDEIVVDRNQKTGMTAITTKKEGAVITISNAKLLPYTASNKEAVAVKQETKPAEQSVKEQPKIQYVSLKDAGGVMYNDPKEIKKKLEKLKFNIRLQNQIGYKTNLDEIVQDTLNAIDNYNKKAKQEKRVLFREGADIIEYKLGNNELRIDITDTVAKKTYENQGLFPLAKLEKIVEKEMSAPTSTQTVISPTTASAATKADKIKYNGKTFKVNRKGELERVDGFLLMLGFLNPDEVVASSSTVSKYTNLQDLINEKNTEAAGYIKSASDAINRTDLAAARTDLQKAMDIYKQFNAKKGRKQVEKIYKNVVKEKEYADAAEKAFDKGKLAKARKLYQKAEEVRAGDQYRLALLSLDDQLKEKSAKKEVVKSTTTVKGYEASKSTPSAKSPSYWTPEMGISYSMGGPADLIGANLGISKGKFGLKAGISQGSYTENSVLKEETVTGTRYDAYGKKDQKSDVNVQNIGIEASIKNILGPLGISVGYVNEAINRANQITDKERILKNGIIMAENTDTYMSNDRNANEKITAGINLGLGKGWYVDARRDLTGDNRRTTVGINKPLGYRTTNK